jgi:hypothetical protein
MSVPFSKYRQCESIEPTFSHDMRMPVFAAKACKAWVASAAIPTGAWL